MTDISSQKNKNLVVDARGKLEVSVNWHPSFENVLEELPSDVVTKLSNDSSTKYKIHFDVLALHFGENPKNPIDFKNAELESSLEDAYQNILASQLLKG